MPRADKAELIEQMLSTERLRRGEVVKSLAAWLRESLRSGLLFGRFDEPLDEYGKRIVRVILEAVDQQESVGAVARPDGSSTDPQRAEKASALSDPKVVRGEPPPAPAPERQK